MDDLLREFLTETNESLDMVDVELVRFEQDPNNAKILDNIFRLVHTIKGTCGFLGLPRLEALAHAAETLMGKFRDGMPVTGDAVTLILATIDQLKAVLGGLERNEREPEGSDADLIARLEQMAMAGTMPGRARNQAVADPEEAIGSLVYQVAGASAAPRRGFARRTRARLPRSAGSRSGDDRRSPGDAQAEAKAQGRSPKKTTARRPTARSPASRSASTSTRSRS